MTLNIMLTTFSITRQQYKYNTIQKEEVLCVENIVKQG